VILVLEDVTVLGRESLVVLEAGDHTEDLVRAHHGRILPAALLQRRGMGCFYPARARCQERCIGGVENAANRRRFPPN
jgi:hypothetical protein